MILPAPIQDLINALSRLPGIGPKTASRLTFFLLRAPEDLSVDLAQALQGLKSGTAFCQTCFHITAAGREQCEICASPKRESGLICVVEEPLDVLALERTGGYQGRYHVLHGALSPIEGIGPEDLKVRPLIERVQAGGSARSSWRPIPSMEGDATAMYLSQQLAAASEYASPGWRAACRSGRPGIRRPEHPAARPERTPGNGLGG
jgi:recombination protein RecR